MNRHTYRRKRKAVAPVVTTLIMIAIALSMSIIIFIWSQGFLSQTSQTTNNNQQDAQNQTAQPNITIKSVEFNLRNSSASITIRNADAVNVTLRTLTSSGTSSNPGFTGSTTRFFVNTNNNSTLSKGAALTLGTPALTSLKPGDKIIFKITTNTGTPTQATYTVPLTGTSNQH